VSPLLVALLLAVPAAQNPAFLAQKWQDEGKTLYAQRHFEAALQAFDTSMGLFASPNTRLLKARTLGALERWAEAVMEFERTEREAAARAATDPRYLGTRDAARKEGAALRGHVGSLELRGTAPPGAQVKVQGQAWPPEALGVAVPVLPGTLEITARAPGYAPLTLTAQVRAGKRSVATLRWNELPPPTDPNSVATTVSLVAVGVGAVAGGALWLAADHQYRTLEARCPVGPCPAEAATVARGERYQTWTHVSLGLAGAGLAAAAVFGLLRPLPSDPDLRIAFTGNGALVAGQF
jgi:hypothetical protein